jgi:putative lipoic acid-binding regulatory protein
VIQEIDFTQAKREGKGFQFPGEFEITAVGKADADLPARVPDLLARAGLDVLHETVRERASAAGNYVSVTISFRCNTREEYETAHAVLRADPAVRYTL